MNCKGVFQVLQRVILQSMARVVRALIIGTIAAGTLWVALPHVAMAGPDTVDVVGNTATANGDQSAGVASGVDFQTPPVETLNVNTLPNDEDIQPIDPAPGKEGIYFFNSGGGNVTVNSGIPQTNVVISTEGDDASGIVAESQGTPGAAPQDPFLGIPIPGDPAVSGGVVQIKSDSDIETEGDNAHGIAAQSRTTGYPAAVIQALQGFSETGISFTVTSVENKKADDSAGVVGEPVQGLLIDADGNPVVGSSGGTFTVNALGTYSFDRGTDFNDMAVGEERRTTVTYTLHGVNSSTNGTDDPVGILVVTVTRTEGGFEDNARAADFERYGLSSKPTPDPADSNKVLTVFPDLNGYVQGLLADAAAGGMGNSVSVTSAGEIETNGKTSDGIFAQSQGGNGGNGRNASITKSSTQGNPGKNGGTVSVTTHVNSDILTKEDDSVGILAQSGGGNGGKGGNSGWTRNAKRGGAGGPGGNVIVEGSGKIETTGYRASGIIALSEGGNGGGGGDGSTFNSADDGGASGQGGNVTVNGDWSITTKGNEARGIWAKSLGGIAGGGGDGGWTGTSSGTGGQGTGGGSVTVITSGGAIKTSGSDAYGIYAESVGGFGGSGGQGASIFYASGGSGASAGPGGDVSVTNDAEITTGDPEIENSGLRSHAIFAQSVGGGGGSGGSGAALVGFGGGSASGGHGGKVKVTNNGQINTFGEQARGIYAQSVGGGGGDGGSSGGLVAIGGQGSGTSAGGNVTANNSGTIETTGGYSEAIFVQSIGGGGGSGGASGGLVSIGGSGSGGGDAGNIVIQNHGDIDTTGISSRAIVAQSIGGGGGDGAGSGGPVSIGGSGGTSGTAGTIDIVNNGRIHTSLADSSAIFAQSIGGGGGSGAGSGGWFASIGGKGGAAGNGNTVTIVNSGIIVTDANWSHAIFAQSIGGGGGNGRGSGAMFAAIGGDGGAAGDGGAVNLTNEAQIATAGEFSFGILAQSIGGGGGNGAGSGAWFASIGGKGFAAGDGGVVTVENKQSIMTTGKWSHSILAQSIGGGGGNGGGTGAVWASLGGDGGAAGDGGDVDVINEGQLATTANSSSGVFAQSVGGGGGTGAGSGALNISLGGDGDAAGNGGNITVINTGAIMTAGDGSHSIFAQSIGGGGGSGDTSGAAVFTLGGDGEASGNAGEVDVTTGSSLETFGTNSSGIFAQSVGGGGGAGNGGNVINVAAGLNVSLGIGIGGDGGSGGDGNSVGIDSTSDIMTHGKISHGIVAQSVGGGGGSGGNSFALSASGNVIPEIPIAINASISIGGDGGSGGNGAAVDVQSSGNITTSDFLSHGILAQSIGGGGGNGGNSTSVSLTYNCDASANVAIGGDGGAGGDGGSVDVDSESAISTIGDFSYGILAQSIGGGGGSGGDSTTISGDLSIASSGGDITPSMSITMSMGGDGGAGGNASSVTVDSGNTITTNGAFSYAILAQSIGGGGGAGGNASSYQFELDNTSGPTSAPLSDLLDVLSFESTVILGGDGGAGGNGGNVTVTSSSDILTTRGEFATGIFAQSVGGGGGSGGNILTFEFSLDDILQPTESYLDEIVDEIGELTNFSMTLEGGAGAGGNGGTVSVTNSGTIVTHGAFAHGIFAQSVGGGGGFSGISETLDISSLLFGDETNGVSSQVAGSGVSFAGSLGGNGSGGDVSVTQTGDILTMGNGAHGIFAQSAGGTLSGGAVSVTLGGNIITEGFDSSGIFAQSVGNSGGQDISIDIQSGSITGGSGTGAGIYMDGGNNNTLTNRGSISSLSGTAIVGGTGNETIDNYGTITGNINLGAGSHAFNNMVGGTFNAGATVNLEGGTLSNSGMFSPGGSGIVLTTGLTGNLMQADSGTCAVDLDFDSGMVDFLNVSGTADLAGKAYINILNAGWSTPGTQQITFLSGAGGVSDLGLSLDFQPSALITYELLYPNATDVMLRTSVDFNPPSAGLNANQTAIANAVNAIQLAGGSASFAPFVDALFRTPDMQSLGSAYDQMSPDSYDIYTKTTSVITQQYTQTLLKRIHSIRSPLRLAGSAPKHADRDQILLAYNGSDASIGQLIGTGELTPEKATYSVWLDGFGKRGDQDETDGFNGYRYNVYGATLGLDRTFGTRFVAGIGIGYSYTDVDLDGARGNGDIDTIFGALYGSYFTRRMYVDAALSYGRQSYDNERNIVIGPLQSTASSDHSGDTYSAFAEGGYNVDIKNWIIQPFVSLHYIYLDEESFRESGAGGVRVESRQTDSLVSELGARFTRVFRIKKSSLIPEISAAWNYDFDVDDRMITASFAAAPGTSFSVQGQDVERHGATVGAGLTFISKGGLSASLKYHGEFRGNYQAHGLLVGLRYEF